ncbi:MAG: SpoIIE family protein phosphatase [Chloroflexi bacterium]|nr:SpoIIE family protein phosphatase [Chloroflexota bacterium]
MIEWAVAGRPIPGEAESGDLHVVKSVPTGILVGAVDGLGHGSEAAMVARIAVSALEIHAGESFSIAPGSDKDQSLISLVKTCHERLRGTRGVALTLAFVSARTPEPSILAEASPWDGTVTWLAVGNVEGVLLRGDPSASPAREYVVLRGGVVGQQLPSLRASIVSVNRGDTLILATDGIGHGFAAGLDLGDPPQEIADRILATHGKTTDDALVVVVRYLGSVRQ